MNSTIISNMGPGIIRKRYYVDYADITAAATTKTLDLDTVPAGTVVIGAVAKHTVAFAGPSVTAMTMALRFNAGSAADIMAASDIFAAVADTTIYSSNSKGSPLVKTAASDKLQAFFTATGANISVLTAGKVWIDIFMWMPEDLTATGPAGNSASGGLL